MANRKRKLSNASDESVEFEEAKSTKARKIDENETKTNERRDREIQFIHKAVDRMDVKQLKQFLKYLQTLYDPNKQRIFKDCGVAGKKAELVARIKKNIRMIYEESINNATCTYTADQYVAWRAQLKGFMRQNSEMPQKARLAQKLMPFDKSQVVNIMDTFFSNYDQDGSLRQKFEECIPKVDLNRIYSDHDRLIKAISKAVPQSRFGSRRDSYCYSRCKSTIDAAVNAMVADAKKLMAPNEHEVFFDYLFNTLKRLKEFPVWDTVNDNQDAVNLKKKLQAMYVKVEETLTFHEEVDEELQNKMENLAKEFEEEE